MAGDSDSSASAIDSPAQTAAAITSPTVTIVRSLRAGSDIRTSLGHPDEIRMILAST